MNIMTNYCTRGYCTMTGIENFENKCQSVKDYASPKLELTWKPNLKCLNKINHIIKKQAFFPVNDTDGCQDFIVAILSYVTNPYNPFLCRNSPLLKPLACVSKLWNACLKEIQGSIALEHDCLKAQEKQFLSAGCQNIPAAIALIQNKQLEVANFKYFFPPFSTKTVQQLWQACPSLKYLVVPTYMDDTSVQKDNTPLLTAKVTINPHINPDALRVRDFAQRAFKAVGGQGNI